MVVFDDGNTVLKTLSFDEPTRWLATQLPRDPDLWNRSWVIKQLATRGTDSAAAAALGRAAIGADYFLTRAEAAAALAAFPAATAVPVLEAAARDTSSAVRSAALGALGELGGDRAVALASAAVHADSSYDVRAAALGALAQADASHRQAVIAEGLGTSSYQESIRTAALRAIVQSNDTTFVDRVEGLLGEYRVPAHVLGALANRGSVHALDVLSRHLDDERAYVRLWVVQAFQFTVRPELALARLRAVQDKLKYPATKKTTAALLLQLEQRTPGE
jgi:HEAT repeat protein